MLKRCCERKQDNSVLAADLVGKDWQGIVAYELKYHRSCYRNYTRDDKSELDVNNNAFNTVVNFVKERIFNKNDILTPSQLQNFYNEISQEKILPRSKPILDKVLEFFNGRISLFKPNSGTPFLFNDEKSKGEIISDYRNMIRIEKSKTIESKRKASDHNCVNTAASIIKAEIKSTDLTYNSWPPTAQELLEKKTVLPPATESFLTALLVRRKRKISQRKQIIISSFGQDLVYNVTNGKHRTSKHALLALCTKRRTGSKQMIKWLNRFGHVISYDETAYVETTLAEDEVKNQIVRSYCPNMVQPSR